MLASSSGPYLVRQPLRVNSSRFSEPHKPPRASGAWRHPHPVTPFRHLGLLWHLWVARLPRMRVNTYIKVCPKLTHVLSRKVLSLTKLKGMNRNPLAITLHYLTGESTLSVPTRTVFDYTDFRHCRDNTPTRTVLSHTVSACIKSSCSVCPIKTCHFKPNPPCLVRVTLLSL